jgi:cytochrome c peroxidase
MANGEATNVVDKLSRATYAEQFRRVFGERIFTDIETAFLATVYSISAFELGTREFRPFDSKFDLFLKGHAMLSPQELRGLALFNRSDKGNCAGCHPSTRRSDGALPLFTDYTYDNLGVPRNPEISANADSGYFDLGLCGPDRTDLADRRDLCGQFKVPTLRNVATRTAFFHNGYFHTLEDALHFYVERDTNPERFYSPAADGSPDKFNDVPTSLRGNVNTTEVPYDRHPGQQPRLSADEIDAVAAFLGTLTDGYDPATNSADPARDVPARDVSPRPTY